MQAMGRWSLLAIAAAACGMLASGCAGSERPGDAVDDDAEADGKSDRATSATLVSVWGATTHATFADGESALADGFELFGPALVEITTAFHEVASVEQLRGWNATEEDVRDNRAQRHRNRALDTTLHVFRRRADGRWRSPIASDDDGGYGLFSRLRVDLDAGTYRVVVGRAATEGDATVDVTATCEGAGCAPAPPPDPVCGAADFDCLVAAAVDPLGGANPQRARSLDVTELPDVVREPVLGAMREIEARTMEGSAYVARVVGVFAVLAAAGDPTVVAYAVLGQGIDDDYQDGVVVGFDLEGHRVYQLEDSN